jgi:hypothetical protein
MRLTRVVPQGKVPKMMTEAREIAAAETLYRGSITTPEHWARYRPRHGDVIICTPAKCGTTWTQAIVAHLLAQGRGLAGPVPEISPWIDANFRDPAEVAAALEAQKGRRVIKTHTPADGFPVWEGVHVVAVYRHPLDVFLSLRKHGMNMKDRPDHPMRRPVEACFPDYLLDPMETDNIDRDSLALMVAHHQRTVRPDRLPRLTVLHYADMVADPAAAVARLAGALEIEADATVRARVVAATGFGAMKARASEYAPAGGTGFWQEDAAFFDSGGTGKWAGVLSAAQVQAYRARMADLVPEAARRRWLEAGGV